MELYNKNINLVFLKERHIDTDTYRNAMQKHLDMTGSAVDVILKGINEYLLILAKDQIRLAFEQSEKEVEDMRVRTREGLGTARRHGKTVGRSAGRTSESEKSKRSKDTIREHSIDFGGTLTDAELMKLCGISRGTYYRYKKEIKQSFI